MESSTAKWSNLPNDLIELIVNLLDSPTDLLRFRSVCAKWRSSASLFIINKNNMSSLPFLLKVPTPTCIDPDLRPCSTLVTESTIFKISNTSKSWLVRVEGSSKETGKVHLKDPLYPSLFPSSKNKKLPKVWNFLDLRVSEVSKAFELKFDGDQFRSQTSSMIKKVVASSQSRDNLAIMALHRRGNLGVWRMNEKKWIQIENDDHEWSKYIDIAYHNNKFYAVDVKGLSISVDCSKQIKHIAPPGVRYGFEYYDDRGRYLVNSLGNLLLVDKPPIRGCNVHFNIYKLNEDENLWVPVDNLGDQALFLGDDCSFSVSAGDFAGCKSNCIYFTVYGYTIYDAYPGYHAWLFDMDDHSLKPLSAIPCFPNPFRLPSTLLKSKKKSLALFLFGC